MTNETMRVKLVNVANLLKDLTMAVVAVAEEFGEVKVVSEEKKEEPKAEPEKKYTFEEVRRVLSEKSGAGFTNQVRELLQQCGASRLSEIKETDYAFLMKAAEEMN